MMKDEEDIAYEVVEHLVGEGVDGVLVYDNMSTDNTKQRLFDAQRDFGSTCDVIIRDDNEVGYYQSRKMTAIAKEAAQEHGADWIIPFDADEIWYAGDRMADVLRDQPRDVCVLPATLYNHFRCSLDLDAQNPFLSMVWRHVDVGVLPKVAFRYQGGCTVEQGNHGVCGIEGEVSHGLLALRHFPYRSWEHFHKKVINGAAAYNASDLPADQGAHWRGYHQILVTHGEEALKGIYEEHFEFLSPFPAPNNAGLIRDPAPFNRWVLK